MDKLIVSVAITGSNPTRQMTPYLPITPEEQAAAAIECWREGASIVHIHVRNEQGQPVCDVDRFRRVMTLIREQGCDIVINLSTSPGVNVTAMEQRYAPIDLHPDIVSFDVGTMNFNEGVFMNPPAFLEGLAKRALEAGVKPEIECFDIGMIYNALRMIDAGLIKSPPFFQFCLGVKGGAPATIKQLLHMTEVIPAGSQWSAFGISRDQLPINVAAIVMGGHPRTGMEDNLYYARGQLAKSNAELVARLVRIGRECGREIASPAETRQILGI